MTANSGVKQSLLRKKRPTSTTFGQQIRRNITRINSKKKGTRIGTSDSGLLVVGLFSLQIMRFSKDFGWDPTITCINPTFDPGKRREYLIEVRNDKGEVKYFKTVRILADYAADNTSKTNKVYNMFSRMFGFTKNHGRNLRMDWDHCYADDDESQ
ncbi:hypothetical protein F5876DRAFT_61657 [Lentinula aff. lateritia]|uniref:Uncharacterized protein n=1 Tax=Lentinula aff. lateritia TaxID=2804960 RepID=A0ACC1UET2_9AGAR|nr:hypothetical protein F5876DRAFT_61657 [Lentinula aff. lateritia]